ncbi:MAG: glycoside hydrolase family 2 protein [Suipraeoptans sp.]
MKLNTKWDKYVDVNHLFEEYPRPSLARKSFINLNGFWKYAFTKSKEAPTKYDGDILVPFSPESESSTVKRTLKSDEFLWYMRSLPSDVVKRDSKWILHFGAVDQIAEIYINGIHIKTNIGGYLPFSIDITKYLQDAGNTLMVRVMDLGESSYLARGKQRSEPSGMFYTGQSGIWQTVWIEEVPTDYIENVEYSCLYDEKIVKVKVHSERVRPVKICISGIDSPILGKSNTDIYVNLTNFFKSWSPESPYLYNTEIMMGEDRVESYFAMRKVTTGPDTNGIKRVFLNNKPYFQKGVIDQGYWPKGLYTPPCDEAFIYDIKKMKDLGFNMIRKHMKVEPERWYYHCDRLGMLVWQDIVNGGMGHRSWFVTYFATFLEWINIRLKDNKYMLTGRKKKWNKKQFVIEMKDTIRALKKHPSIVTWTIFNEGWGQFDANVVTKVARIYDKTRLIDQASGWFDQRGGDFRSIHNYFLPLRFGKDNRVIALTEFGGFSYSIPGHRFSEKTYGYRIFKNKKKLSMSYQKLMEQQILPNMNKGLSVTIYTQLSDIEEEVNGIVSYDRKVSKFDEEMLREYNERLTL